MAINEFKKGPSGLTKLMSLGKAVAGFATGNPLMGVQGLSELRPDSPFGRAAGLAGSVGSLASGGAPTGSRTETGKATLGVNTDLGYGPPKPELTNPADNMGAFQRRIRTPTLGVGSF
jgi:hypothetical protein